MNEGRGVGHRQEHKRFNHSKRRDYREQGYGCWKVLVAGQEAHGSSLLLGSVFSEKTRAGGLRAEEDARKNEWKGVD